jgi:hypothetical protein
VCRTSIDIILVVVSTFRRERELRVDSPESSTCNWCGGEWMLPKKLSKKEKRNSVKPRSLVAGFEPLVIVWFILLCLG